MDQTREQQIRSTYAHITRTLIRRGLTITTMESATAGQIASLLTDTEGSSAILKGAFVTYSNESKIMQGVPEQVISTYGVYSAETAKAMAEACRRAYHAGIGIGVTGTMGNVDPANHDSVPGQVYMAIDYQSRTFSYYRELEPQSGRLAYKLEVAMAVAEELLRLLGEDGESGNVPACAGDGFLNE